MLAHVALLSFAPPPSERELRLAGLRRLAAIRPPPPPPFSTDTPMALRLFSAEQPATLGARCLDGTPAGYYFRQGASNNTVIWLEGGGLCVEPIDCWQRTKENLGSSTHWPTTKEDSNNVLSTDASNPFANWTHVFVPYCTGDTYMGRQRAKNFMGLTFAGHLGLDAIVSDLLNTTGLASAERVLFSGQSAGGIGVFHNADWLGERLRAAGSTGWYAASPQAGAFMAADDLVMMPEYATLNMSLSFTQFASAYLVEFFGGTNTNPDERPLLDASCVAAHASHPHECWSVSTAYPYVETPLFVAQNTIDKVQAGDVFGADWWPLPLKDHGAAKAEYLDYFGARTRAGIVASVLNNSAKADGLFVPSCYQHTDNLCMKGGSRVGGVSYAAALADWCGGTQRRVVEQCSGSEPCNPECGAC